MDAWTPEYEAGLPERRLRNPSKPRPLQAATARQGINPPSAGRSGDAGGCSRSPPTSRVPRGKEPQDPVPKGDEPPRHSEGVEADDDEDDSDEARRGAGPGPHSGVGAPRRLLQGPWVKEVASLQPAVLARPTHDY
eukprot:12916483-Heterocapsa_arctica.AAC.1